jgi:hypothetical protein
MRGSIIDVMNPQTKNRVVTAARAADRSRFVDGISFRSFGAAFVPVAIGRRRFYTDVVSGGGEE